MLVFVGPWHLCGGHSRAQEPDSTCPQKGVRLCKIVLGPFSNDYPEGKQATNLKQWPSQFPCNEQHPLLVVAGVQQ